LSLVAEGNTLAEGIRVRHPVRGDAVLQEVQQINGMFTAVDEDEITRCRDLLAHKGFFVEYTSAVVLAAYYQLIGKSINKLPESWQELIVLVLTGSGLKNLS
jgi:threonine synthase